MRNYFQKIPIILSVAFFLVSCAEKTDEDLIMELMEDIGNFAEKKDISSITMNLAEDYTDFEGRGKRKARDMLEYYFDEYRGIVIHVLSTQVDEVNPPEAYIQTDVALSSGAAKVLRKMIKFSTDNYRLKMRLIRRNSKWKIQHAEWRYVSLNELFPESLSILKKIFPNI